MSESQLRRAYDLIKQGREQEAIDLIEPLLRFDPDNADAWWLLANATDDPDSKRDALNNVLRLSDNPTRVEKARQMLRIVNAAPEPDAIFDDFDSFDEPYAAPAKRGFDDVQPQTPIIVNERRRGGPGCCMGCLGIIGVLVVLSCVGIVAFATLAPRLFEEGFDFLSAPSAQEYRDGGALEPNQLVEGEVLNSDDRVGYIYSTTRAENITVRLETSNSSIPPMAFVYNQETGDLLMTNFSSQTDAGRSGFAYTDASLPGAGQYLIIVRPIPFVGQFDVGVGEYTVEVVP